jgi:hypothetical protein
MLDWFANNLMQANPEKFQALAIGKTTGCINTIKCLSPKPSEFITTASEFL